MLTNPNTNDNIIDIDLSVTSKKKFRIDHDDNRIIELNTSDMSIIPRITEVTPRLQELQDLASKIALEDDLDEESTDISAYVPIAEKLREIDSKMRDLLDYIFDSKIADKVAPSGSMYDLFDGQYRYEHIIAKLVDLYEANLKEEFKKLNNQMKLHTAKYTKH